MMNGETRHSIRIVTLPGTPPEFVRARYEDGQKALALKLFHVLWTNPLPAVVNIEEKESLEPPDFPYLWAERTLTITATVTPVTHKHVTYEHLDQFQPVGRAGSSRFRRWLDKLVRRIP